MITDSAALQSSWQQRAPLLCHDCEQRFHRNGENWIFSKCLRRDGNFPLRDLLIARTADAGQGGATQVYLAAKIPEIDINALIYFGTSMFWRGSIHSWNSDGTVPVPLGQHQEPIRKYLMGETGFPNDCSMTVMVAEGQYSKVSYPPLAEMRGDILVGKFPMAGMNFSFTAGNIPDEMRSICILRGNGNPIAKTTKIEAYLQEDLRTKILNNPQARKFFGLE